MDGPGEAAAWDALVVHPDDDVGVALRDVAADETVDVRMCGAIRRMSMVQAIKLGHKFALHALAAGTPIRKYGETIGVATVDIAQGEHVHVHNLASRRARSA
jgi:altronate dehydratase small subunit